MSSSEDPSHQQSSGNAGQVVPQRLSPALINLEHLSPEEQSIILTVLQRDEQLRQHDQDRVKMLKSELHDLRKKSAVNAADENGNGRVCIRCREPLGLVFNSGESCPKCQHKVCKNCKVTLPSGTRWLCTICHKNMQLQLETGEWHYSQLQVDQVPLFGSDLVKASLAKAKHSLTDPTTVPVLTASDLRSSLKGKRRSHRQDSRTSSDYSSSSRPRQNSRRSASSGSEQYSVTDSSEVDAVVEPISGFTFQRVSFRRDRKGSEKGKESPRADRERDTTDQAYEAHHESMSSREQGSVVFSDSGLEDSLCSGQTGTSSPDALTFSPCDVLLIPPNSHSDEGQLLSSDLYPLASGTVGSDDESGSDVSTDSREQTGPMDLYGIFSPASSEDESSKVDIDSMPSLYVGTQNLSNLLDFYRDGSQDNETGILVETLPSTRKPARSPSVQNGPPKTVFTESSHSHQVDVSYSLNSLYQGPERGFLHPKLKTWQHGDEFKKDGTETDKAVDSMTVKPLEPPNQGRNSVPNPTVSENGRRPFQRNVILDDSSSDSVTTPSDEGDSFCELELDWDLRCSSPDFQEVQLQTKLKKNQNLMQELMKEIHKETPPEFFLRSNSTSSDDGVFLRSSSREDSSQESVRPDPRGSLPPSKVKGLETLTLNRRQESTYRENWLSDTGGKVFSDSDLSSSVSSWIDSNSSSDENPPARLPLFTAVPPSNQGSDEPSVLKKPLSKKTLIPRPDWAAMKVQQWKTSSSAPKSFRMKRPGGKSTASHQPKIFSHGPVLITEKNKGTYVLNPESHEGSISDSSSDESETDSDSKSITRKRTHPRNIPSRGSSTRMNYNCSISSDSELSTILELSEEDQSALSLENTPKKVAAFDLERLVIPTVVVSEQQAPRQSSTEEDADDECDAPHLLGPEYEPKLGWPKVILSQTTVTAVTPSSKDGAVEGSEPVSVTSGKVSDWNPGQAEITTNSREGNEDMGCVCSEQDPSCIPGGLAEDDQDYYIKANGTSHVSDKEDDAVTPAPVIAVHIADDRRHADEEDEDIDRHFMVHGGLTPDTKNKYGIDSNTKSQQDPDSCHTDGKTTSLQSQNQGDLSGIKGSPEDDEPSGNGKAAGAARASINSDTSLTAVEASTPKITQPAATRPPSFTKSGSIDGRSHTSVSSLQRRLSPGSNLSKGSSQSMTSLYSQAGEENYGKYVITGDMNFGMSYNYKTNVFEVKVKACRDLAPVDAKRIKSDPYVKTYLLPDKTKASKRKTFIRKGTVNPQYDVALRYHISQSELETRTLSLTVWNNDAFGRNDFLGEVLVNMDSVQLDDYKPHWHPLGNKSQPAEGAVAYKGDLFLSLMYSDGALPEPEEKDAKKKKKKDKSKKPSKRADTKGVLHVKIKQAKNLVGVRMGGSSNPFVKGYLEPDRSKTGKHKTQVLRGTCNPVWEHVMKFDNVTLHSLKERCLELTVWDHETLSSNEFLGGTRLNLGTGEYQRKPASWNDAMGEEIRLWEQMLKNPGKWSDSTVTLRPNMVSRLQFT